MSEFEKAKSLQVKNLPNSPFRGYRYGYDVLRDVHLIPGRVSGPHLHPIFELLGNSWQIVRSLHTCPRSATEWECRCGGGSLCVFGHFAWLEVRSVKAALSHPAPLDLACRDHQPSSPLPGRSVRVLRERTPLAGTWYNRRSI